MGVTKREQEIIRLWEDGLSPAQIGEKLGLTTQYVRGRVHSLCSGIGGDRAHRSAMEIGSKALVGAILLAKPTGHFRDESNLRPAPFGLTTTLVSKLVNAMPSARHHMPAPVASQQAAAIDLPGTAAEACSTPRRRLPVAAPASAPVSHSPRSTGADDSSSVVRLAREAASHLEAIHERRRADCVRVLLRAYQDALDLAETLTRENRELRAMIVAVETDRG
jgi:hypothetical protein